jgi:hypothetical protein
VPRLVHVVDLKGGFDELWSKRMSSGTRNKIRKGDKLGVAVEWRSGEALVALHYELYRRWTLRRAGERGLPRPVALRLASRREPFERFVAVARQLGKRFEIGIASLDGEPVASTIILRQGRHALYWRSASDRERAGRSYPNYVLLARALERAAESGAELFHMGESGGVETLMAFKDHFGAERVVYDELRFEPPVADSLVRLREGAVSAAIKGALAASSIRRSGKR